MNPTKNEFAVLLFGMPRFYAKNLNSIKTHFSLETFDIDFYAHLWEKICNIPEDDIKNNLSNVKLPYLHYRMLVAIFYKSRCITTSDISRLFDLLPHQI